MKKTTFETMEIELDEDEQKRLFKPSLDVFLKVELNIKEITFESDPENPVEFSEIQITPLHAI